MKTRIHGLIILTAAILLISGCAANIGHRGPNGLSAEVYPVKLVPQGPGTLKVDTPNKGCINNPHNGCVLFGENTVGLMKFYLRGSKGDVKTCKDKGVNEVITRIQLTTKGDDGDFGTKGDFSELPDAWLKEEAFLALDLSNGYVYDESAATGRTQVWLLNTNFNDPSEGPKVFWYQVTVEACDNSKGPWITDPRGENRGTNW